MLKFLVTGAAGQLGKDVVRELENRGYEVTGSGSKKRKTAGRYVKMDITDRNEVEAVMKKLRPDIVIHCAAWTAVDAAEEPENYEKVWEVNGKGTANLASACQKSVFFRTCFGVRHCYNRALDFFCCLRLFYGQ